MFQKRAAAIVVGLALAVCLRGDTLRLRSGQIFQGTFGWTNGGLQ